MRCNNCGKENVPDSTFCENCGQVLSYENSTSFGYQPNTAGNVPAVVSMILGIVSVVSCGFPAASIAAIILGCIAKSKGTTKGGMATLGLILGIVGIVEFIIAIIFYIVYYGALYGLMYL